MYGDQSGEFVCGYWGVRKELKSSIMILIEESIVEYCIYSNIFIIII